MKDPYRLQRFIDAQQAVFDTVCEELRAGAKRTHWMWFIFPQIAGLGSSLMARRFALASLDEARAYLHHPLLGPRLRACSHLVARIEGRAAAVIFGYPDDMKFRSSMTLFVEAGADDDNAVFVECLRKYFNGEPDPLTLRQLYG
ncbi:MAG: DUF1810 domain-containing protein [Burkholderiaceae bacterium]